MLARHIPTLLPHDVLRSLVDVFRPGEEILGSISSLAVASRIDPTRWRLPVEST